MHFLAISKQFGRSEVVSQPVLELQNITKNFGQQTILNHLSLSIKEGEVVVILGPSGCGKSTLLRCINKLESIQEGDILLDGQSILSGSLSLQDIRQKIGMVFQDYELFPHMDVLQNLTLAPVKALKRNKEEVQAEAETLLKRVGLEQKKHSYARELSGGQKQRVAIIRSLLMHPEIILFDEVTASLDPEMVREVLVLINDLAKEGRTMLIVTHEMEFARAIADRIIFMDKGEIIEENTAQNFFQHPQTQRAQAFLTTFDFNHF
nr:amino acid ABC transporter ATP-binding protein [Streptococcus suis]